MCLFVFVCVRVCVRACVHVSIVLYLLFQQEGEDQPSRERAADRTLDSLSLETSSPKQWGGVGRSVLPPLPQNSGTPSSIPAPHKKTFKLTSSQPPWLEMAQVHKKGFFSTSCFYCLHRNDKEMLILPHLRVLRWTIVPLNSLLQLVKACMTPWSLCTASFRKGLCQLNICTTNQPVSVQHICTNRLLPGSRRRWILHLLSFLRLAGAKVCVWASGEEGQRTEKQCPPV